MSVSVYHVYYLAGPITLLHIHLLLYLSHRFCSTWSLCNY